jgi:biopolymer transport protein ExbD
VKFTSEQIEEPEINVISLIDVILVLLIFFMATATFEQQSRLKVDLPKASKTQSDKDNPDSLVIQINEAGQFFIGGRQVMNPTEDLLRKAISDVSKGKIDQRVILRADARTQHQNVVLAMDLLGQMGFSNLSIATLKSTGP